MLASCVFSEEFGENFMLHPEILVVFIIGVLVWAPNRLFFFSFYLYLLIVHVVIFVR